MRSRRSPSRRTPARATCRWNPGWACTGSPVTECHADQVRRRQEGRRRGLRRRQHRAVRRLLGDLPVPEPTCHRAARPAPARASAATASCFRRGVRRRQQPVGRRLLGDLHARVRVHVHAAAARRQHPGAGRLPRLQLPHAHRLRAGRDRARRRSIPGLVDTMLDADGQAGVRSRHGVQRYITSAATFAQWYTRRRRASTTPTRDDADALEQRRPAATSTAGARTASSGRSRRRPTTAATSAASSSTPAGNPIPCTSHDASSTDCDAGARWAHAALVHRERRQLRRRLPDRRARRDADVLPGRRRHLHAAQPRRDAATIPPPYDPTGSYPARCRRALHNFSFTSEVRYWFPYDSTKTYKLDFLGDDDVWMFVNRRLAVDIGGIHTAAAPGRSRSAPPTRRPSG